MSATDSPAAAAAACRRLVVGGLRTRESTGMQESNGRGGGGGGGLPSGDDVEAALGCPLHPLDAEGGQQLWARGEALGGHLAQSVGGVRRQLGGRVHRLHVPRGGRGEDGRLLARLCEVDGRVHAALVPADDHPLVAVQARPRAHPRIVQAELRPAHAVSAFARVLELARRPDDISRPQRILSLRTVGLAAAHAHVEGPVGALLDPQHLAAPLDTLLQLHDPAEVVQVVCVLRARRVLGVELVGGRGAVRHRVEVKRVGPPLRVERGRDEAHLLRPLPKGGADAVAFLDQQDAGGVEAEGLGERDGEADPGGAGTHDDHGSVDALVRPVVRPSILHRLDTARRESRLAVLVAHALQQHGGPTDVGSGEGGGAEDLGAIQFGQHRVTAAVAGGGGRP
mmetsp:Transcript_6527/g.19634  ORF Transcript_6527/g.19634 Transcript_6527/m.19634 type:complete len:396 (-) Transcript_6527:221-1408(-)